MRAGGCTLQQALTPEAATVVKQSVSLARRRGHAQVTPLHVASTMLSSSAGLLRAACLRSHSHPLQCKALELCFNVALNRLPALTTTGPLLGGHGTHPHHHHHLLNQPTLSNALVAAFKRAQAHQRRGSVESQQQQQQQPLLTVKIEIEQLVISILDDPSVSRVMREAGFNSTQVKGNIDRALSLEFASSSSPNYSSTTNLRKPNKEENHGHRQLMIRSSPVTPTKQFHPRNDQDVKSVMDCLIGRKKRSIAVVGESLATTESVITGMMDRVERGEVPDTLKGIQFITLPLISFANLSRIEVEQKVGELRCLVKSYFVSRGVVLYLGDLKWVAEYKEVSFANDKRGRMMISYYCPVEHVIMELGRMICSAGGTLEEEGRFWFMGIATYQTYMRCRVGHPSLESIWGLHPLTVPVGSLGLSLSHDSYLQSPLKTKRSNEDRSQWSSPDDKEIEDNIIRTSSLPSWLQQCMETTKNADSGQENCVKPRDLFSKSSQNVCTVPVHPWKERRFWPSYSNSDQECSEPNNNKNSRTIMFQSSSKDPKKPRQTVQALHNMSINSSSPDHEDDQSMEEMEYHYHPKFKELNAENFKSLCMALEKKVPWQVDIIPEISSTILQCRSGIIRRRDSRREDTWLFFQGCDVEGKNRVARELASLIFGSSSITNSSPFVSIGWRNQHLLSSTRSTDSSDDVIISNRSKRSRSEASETYLERFAAEIRNNPHRVFLLDEMEQVDYDCQMGIKRAMERGVFIVRGSNGEEEEEEEEEEEGIGLQDAIIILSCESFDSRSRACSPLVRSNYYSESHDDDDDPAVLEKEGSSSCGSLDLNLTAGDDNDQEVDDDAAGLVDLVDRRFLFKIREEV